MNPDIKDICFDLRVQTTSGEPTHTKNCTLIKLNFWRMETNGKLNWRETFSSSNPEDMDYKTKALYPTIYHLSMGNMI